jgi:hypothetical protein
MAKDWKEMSYSEKCDALRADVLRAFQALNALGAESREMSAKLNEVAAAVERLESGKK